MCYQLGSSFAFFSGAGHRSSIPFQSYSGAEGLVESSPLHVYIAQLGRHQRVGGLIGPRGAGSSSSRRFYAEIAPPIAGHNASALGREPGKPIATPAARGRRAAVLPKENCPRARHARDFLGAQ